MPIMLRGPRNTAGISKSGSLHILLCVLILVLFSLPGFAQYIIKGKVVDANNDAVLPGVNLQVNDSSVYTTDPQGNFKFESSTPDV